VLLLSDSKETLLVMPPPPLSHTDKPTTVLLVESPVTPKPWTRPTSGKNKELLPSTDNKLEINGETLVQRPPGDKLLIHNHQRLLSLKALLLVQIALGLPTSTPPPTTVLPLDLPNTPSP
jgi:hypothetical protein